jgi:ATP-dependent Clp protease, protease subunit
MGVSHYNDQIRRIILSGEIREETAAGFLEQMTALERVDMDAPITVYIDTYGGNVRAALAMYDMMRICACPIETVGIGKVMSAGVLLLAAGDKGNRYLTSNCGVMIHQISGGIFGTVSEMETNVKETQYLQELYVSILSKHSGVPKTKILKDMQIDNYMTAKQAIQYGVADLILPSRKNILLKRKK